MTFIMITACRKQSAQTESLAYGIYHSECDVNCFSGYLISNGKLYRDKAEIDDKIKHFRIIAEPDEKYQIAKELLDHLPLEELMQSGNFLGNPDGHDQGGIYLSYKKSGLARTWNIDVVEDRFPPAIAEYVKRIKSVDGRLRK